MLGFQLSLGAFAFSVNHALDIVSNVIEDSGINREKPIKDQVLEVAQSLKDAASLIDGPSKAKKLKEDILKKIEEVE